MPATLSAHAPQVSDRLGSYHVPARGTAAYWLSPMERSQLVKQGVPAREVVALADAMAVPRDQLMRVLGLARSTVERKIAQRGPLSQHESEKMVGIERLIGQVDAMVREAGEAPDDFAAAHWFARWTADPVPALGGVGCGVATASVYWVMFFSMISWVRRARSMRDIRGAEGFSKPDFAVLKRLVQLGLPIALALFFFGFICAFPSDGSRIGEYFCTCQSHQARCFRIPLIPTNQHAKFPN